ncbi:MAG: 50S ribosomal protein L6 [Nitrospirae bacterium RIFCSPLOW2_12_42_9]|nr:MAG: 50S ribosomal protein L6 [Nitrospirae bacterium RIFCSPHIGHO2_02_FULL_42_12]OGW58457.1 MAG: 50S ribosomal protein L6 [Nitrospirae bacterium RIFCSPLOW2_12_42_9]
MSRIGKKPIEIPKGVDVNINGQNVAVKGPKGSLQKSFPSEISITKKDDVLSVTIANTDKETGALHGLSRTLIANMIEGVMKGFEKTLEISGVGYKAMLQGKNIVLTLGYSHQITYPLPAGIDAAIDKQTVVKLKGIDKELLGQTASNIRSLRGPEPYKGKGVKYKDERIVRKEGKTGK